jgi:hypothetical protein
MMRLAPDCSPGRCCLKLNALKCPTPSLTTQSSTPHTTARSGTGSWTRMANPPNKSSKPAGVPSSSPLSPSPRSARRRTQQGEMLFDEGKEPVHPSPAVRHHIHHQPGAPGRRHLAQPAQPSTVAGHALKRPVCCSTGGTTSSAACAPSSARSKRPKPPSG